ncbi:DNA ligase D [Agrobacterium sp.]|jgi:bifunctional non-homologous end joining protein LigD|uniref:DNA ligase D n=1 Tax=Agrobacterium sp. TaxID=361 RepID=UPI0028ADEB01|nr:DNA ligase D [Agrobacterium sp.]
MALQTYNSKRNFKQTPEPPGRRAAKGVSNGNSFVIQKHDATRLHYDFRLEMGGVLKSWAVTRGPSLDPTEKRLAVHVEDHPLDYGDFEGIIPKGQYGSGTVIVWDRGSWTPVGDAKKGYRKGHLEFELDGEKMKGRWHLVRMKDKPEEKRENWLLIKAEDEDARRGGKDILDEFPKSAKSGRSIEAVAEDPDAVWETNAKVTRDKTTVRRKSSPSIKASRDTEWPTGAREARMRGFVQPALATLKPKPPAGDGWLHEIKFDGYRLQAHIRNGQVTLLTRSGLDWSDRFGTRLSKALADLPVSSAIIDGEIVVERDNGASDFSALQSDLSEGHSDRFVYYAFDMIYLDGHNLVDAALIDRKILLENLIRNQKDGSVLRYSAHFGESGELVLSHACRLSLEGVVSKKRDGKYISGRKGQWIKSKCSERQEFVIGGYTPATAIPDAIGSLAMGIYEDGRFIHVGRVGTGFSVAVAQDLYRKLHELDQKTSPFDDKLSPSGRRDLIFVKPVLVAEVEFQAWSEGGNLRHASFRGLRDDKASKEVVREATRAAQTRKMPASSVKLTHPDRIYWPDEGITKTGLVDYYSQVWRFMAPFVVSRPLSLLRAPDGITGRQRFFQKHGWKGMNANIEEVTDPKDRSGGKLLKIVDFDGLVALVQSAALEIHPWGTTVDHWEKPDILTMDIDPADDVPWDNVIAAAYELKKRIEASDLFAFVKTSGGKGLHVVSPLEPKATWAQVKAFAKSLANDMSADDPSLYLATATKAKRKGRIFIDYLRNGRGNTAVAPYSTRARPGAAVSTPLAWDELNTDLGPAHFTINNVPRRLEALSKDPWDGFFAAAKPIVVRTR